MARKEVGDENSREREREREKGKGFGECPLPTELTHEVVRVRPGKAAGEVEGEGVGVGHRFGFWFGCDREVLRVCVWGGGIGNETENAVSRREDPRKDPSCPHASTGVASNAPRVRRCQFPAEERERELLSDETYY